MALTYVQYAGNGSTTNFAITFPYIDAAHVKVSLDGVTTSAFTVNTVTGNVDMDAAPASGVIVRVYRQTPGRTEANPNLLVDFQDGSVLTEADLDTMSQQLLYLSQEAQETGSDSLPIDFSGNYDAGNRRIKNLGSPLVEADAVNKSYVDGLSLYGVGATIPQSWAFTAADLSGLTGTVTVELSSPDPVASNTDLYIVSIDGYMQRPGGDFVVGESSGTYTLTIYLGGITLSGTEPISVQNFGIARSIIDPNGVQMIDADTPAITAIGDPSPNVPIVVVEKSDGTDVATINNDGDLAVSGDISSGGNLTVTGDITAASCDTTGAVNGTTSNLPRFTASSVTFDNNLQIKGKVNLFDDSEAHTWGTTSSNSLSFVRQTRATGGPGLSVAGLGSSDPYYQGKVPIPVGGPAGTVVHPWCEIDTSGLRFVTHSNRVAVMHWSATFFCDNLSAGNVMYVACMPVRYDGSAIGSGGYPNGKTLNLNTNPDLEMRWQDYYAGSGAEPVNRVRSEYKIEGSSTASDPIFTLNGMLVTTVGAMQANEYVSLGMWSNNSNQTSMTCTHAGFFYYLLG